ncbi:septal ring lytic transglycosylase RlpA family protein [Ancylobacter crimeensis]|uniref:septal ring lytic transglycosylase RlpA family protein n=1 Tax=Ancylobacter crimeensis TaxID=2579147 RepID=UPI003CCFE0EA
MSFQVSTWSRVVLVVGAGLLVANCTSNTASKLFSKIDPKYGVSASPRVVQAGQPVPKGGGAYRVGKPYQIAGKTYVPQENPKNYKTEGLASWYGDDFHGRLTANGEVFDMDSIAAAHPTLPMPCYVRVTNLANRRSIIARVNDRGPYHANRVMDVSRRTAELLGFKQVGTARVRVEYVGLAPLDGSDDRKLIATLSNERPAILPSDTGVMVASNDSPMPVRPSSMRVPSMAPPPPDRPFDLGDALLASARPSPVQTPIGTPRQAPRPAVAPSQVAMAQESDRIDQIAADVPEPPPAPARVAAPAPSYVAAPAPAPLPPVPQVRTAVAAAKPVIRPGNGATYASLGSVTPPKPVQRAPAPVAKPVTAAPAAVVASAAPRPAKPVTLPAPSQSAAYAPSPAASGWVVGPQPVAVGFAPSSGYIGSGY